MLHSLGFIFTIIGGLGMVLSLVLLAYATKKHDGGWDTAARDTGGRAILILILGIILMSLGK